MKYVAPVENQVEYIFRSIAERIIVDLLYKMNIYDEYGGKIQFISDYTANTTTEDDNHNPLLVADNRLFATLQLGLNPKNAPQEVTPTFPTISSGGAYRQQLAPCFIDHEIRVNLSEQFQVGSMTIEVKLRAKDRNLSFKTLDRLYQQFTQGELYTVSNITYYYPLSNVITGLLLQLAKLRKMQVNNFVRYLREFSNNLISTAQNGDTGERILTVTKKAANLLIKIDFDQNVPEAVKIDQASNAWDLTFTLTTQFDRPMMMVLEYPIIVYNQLIPEEMISVKNVERIREQQQFKNSPFLSVDRWRVWNYEADTTVPFIHLPWYDDWTPDAGYYPASNYLPFLSIAFTLDDADNVNGVTVIDLSNLGGVTLITEVLNDILSYTGSALSYEKQYALTVFANECAIEPTSLSIDGNLLTIPNRDITKNYHLVFMVNKEFSNGSDNRIRVLKTDINAAG